MCFRQMKARFIRVIQKPRVGRREVSRRGTVTLLLGYYRIFIKKY